MSASSKKKIRKEERVEKLTERQLAEQKEAKKLKITSAIFVAGLALIMVVGLALIGWNLYANSGIRENNTDAVKIGNHTLSVTDLNYYYVDLLNEARSDTSSLPTAVYGQGLDVSKPLDEQMYNTEEGKTWADFYIDKAITEASSVLALCDAADKASYKLTEEDIATVDETILAIETQAIINNYSNVEDFLKAVYGHGAKTTSYRKYVENVTLAQSYYNHYTEELTYTDEEIAEHEKEHGSYSSFTYTYFQVTPDTFMEHEAGSTEHNHSEEDQAAALKAAEETANKLVEAVTQNLADGETTNKETLDKAIASLEVYNPNAGTEEETADEKATDKKDAKKETNEEETDAEEATDDETAEGESAEGETTDEETVIVPTSTEHTDYPYSYINTAMAEWLTSAEHKSGDVAAVPYYTLDDEGNKTDVIESYYVVVFGDENKHEENMVTIRHILKSYEDGTTNEETGDTTYSDESKEAAEKKINDIKKQWEKGEKTAESFGELAKEHSDDSSSTTGGLYEHMYQGWAVAEFNDWCFDESRKEGDVGVVHTQYGCHLIYFVCEEDQTYRNYMITTDMRAEESTAWYEKLRDEYNSTAKKLDTKLLATDIILIG